MPLIAAFLYRTAFLGRHETIRTNHHVLHRINCISRMHLGSLDEMLAYADALQERRIIQNIASVSLSNSFKTRLDETPRSGTRC